MTSRGGTAGLPGLASIYTRRVGHRLQLPQRTKEPVEEQCILAIGESSAQSHGLHSPRGGTWWR